MTSNNLEAIKLLKTCVERLQEQGFSSHGNTVSELNEALALLQADEVQEDSQLHQFARQKGLCKCPTSPKPTKETKLQYIRGVLDTMPTGKKETWMYELISLLTDALLEEEY